MTTDESAGYFRLKAVRAGLEYHTVLPPEAQDILRKAAKVQPDAMQPTARAEAIERAIVEVKLSYPQFFKEYR